MRGSGKLELVGRPVVGRKEAGKVSTVGGAEPCTEVVTLGAVSFKMVMHAREKCKTGVIWFPHILKFGQFFTERQ